MLTIKIQFLGWEINVTLKSLFHRLVHGHPEGITLATDEINNRRKNQISKQALINKLNPDGTTDITNIDDFERISDRLRINIDIARHFAAKDNGVVVVMPTVAEGDMALLDDFMAIAKEIGEVSARFQQAFADGELTDQEFSAVEDEIDEAVQALLRFKESVKLRVSK
jgi:hypothetical protein